MQRFITTMGRVALFKWLRCSAVLNLNRSPLSRFPSPISVPGQDPSTLQCFVVMEKAVHLFATFPWYTLWNTVGLFIEYQLPYQHIHSYLLKVLVSRTVVSGYGRLPWLQVRLCGETAWRWCACWLSWLAAGSATVLDKAGRAGVGVAWCSIGVDGSSVRTKVALIPVESWMRSRPILSASPARSALLLLTCRTTFLSNVVTPLWCHRLMTHFLVCNLTMCTPSDLWAANAEYSLTKMLTGRRLARSENRSLSISHSCVWPHRWAL